jgi:DNA topoisomerase-1
MSQAIRVNLAERLTGTTLVIVESPAKAKTIMRYLGKGYSVIASYGHIRDLSSKTGSVKPDQNFEMVWENSAKATNALKSIEQEVKKADHVYLATDPDREGEAISWHVVQYLHSKKLQKNIPFQRIVFHEITKKAVQEAIRHPRELDQNLVEAYLTRRALDYLVGYTLSPVLWRKLPGSRSAGRVQSVALRLVVDREEEIERFKKQEYWSVSTIFQTNESSTLTARFVGYHGKKIEKLTIASQEEAQFYVDQIQRQTFYVQDRTQKQVKRHAPPPFITSTLQQDASRQLGLGASQTMRVAQKLYEGASIDGESVGLITYMRTDGVSLSQEAVTDIRQQITQQFGETFLPDKPLVYKTKVKNAQEAHEAIRPTSMTRTPQQVAPYLDELQLKLYTLIWKRTMACQMESARFDQVTIFVAARDEDITLRATGTTLIFEGFLKVYQDSQEENDSEGEQKIPPLQIGQSLQIQEVIPSQHFTQPPPRYGEATLVKKMEELGIGRPSTYAAILQVLQDRSYVREERRQLIPSDRGRVVTAFLQLYFQQYVAYDFTAQLEEELDDISNGTRKREAVLQFFWKAFWKTVIATQDLTMTQVIDELEKALETYLFSGTRESRQCPTCSEGILHLKLSRYGAFLGCNRYPSCGYTHPLDMDSSDQPAQNSSGGTTIGLDPLTQEIITLRSGIYGPYLQWDPNPDAPPVVSTIPVEAAAKKRVSKKSMSTGDPAIDAALNPSKKKTRNTVPTIKRVTIPAIIRAAPMTIEIAMRLKTLPYPCGVNRDGEAMTVGSGQYGPYVRCGSIYASIPKDLDFLALTPEQAQQLLDSKQEKQSKTSFTRSRAKTKTTTGFTKG